MLKKKSLGQNFLKDKNIVGKIIDAGDIHSSDVVVEVGPGEGVMTEVLLRTAGKVIAVEKDHRLIPLLQRKFAEEIGSGKLELIEQDILKLDMSKVPFDIKRYKVIANIPYYITGQIIRMFLETENQPGTMVLLVQKEVAERIVVRENKPFDSAQGKESLLSLSVKVFGEPKLVRTVGRGAFSPQPNVDSAVLLIENISKNKLEGRDEKFFFEVLHAGFAHKRKQLLPNLSALFPKEKLARIFDECNISPLARAEDIPLQTWIQIISAAAKIK